MDISREVPGGSKIRYTCGEDGETVIFYIGGELDHYGVKEIREQVDAVISASRPKKVTLDLCGVTFTDSAGLGLVLGRYTKLKDIGGELTLKGVSPEFLRILRMASADKLMKIAPAEERKKNETK
ncbi:MAG: STAS domain-containing protein [Firmicutes bacterium]|nr:STAS domain-containing protein [Bacillota bacterium]